MLCSNNWKLLLKFVVYRPSISIFSQSSNHYRLTTSCRCLGYQVGVAPAFLLCWIVVIILNHLYRFVFTHEVDR
jgi:hypothetical protein